MKSGRGAYELVISEQVFSFYRSNICLFLMCKKGDAIRSISMLRSQGVGKKDSDYTGEQKRRSFWGVGFLRSTQCYSAFIFATSHF
jgi:hypothetical protein